MGTRYITNKVCLALDIGDIRFAYQFIQIDAVSKYMRVFEEICLKEIGQYLFCKDFGYVRIVPHVKQKELFSKKLKLEKH